MNQVIALASALAALFAVGGFTAWVYARREFEVRARSLLLAARLAAVALVAALLWNPVVARPRLGTGAEPVAILDASASMAARTDDGSRVWDAARARARALAAEGARLTLAGDGAGARLVAPGALDDVEPAGARSALAAAVRSAAEAGAPSVTLLTDRRVADPAAVVDVARRLGVELIVADLPAAGANLGVARIRLPASVGRGEPVRGEVDVEGTADRDSIEIAVDVDGRERATLRVAAPSARAGGVATASFEIARGLEPGERRVTARIVGTDAFAADDARTRAIGVDSDEAGVLLVAFRPDWEARFLLPVLDRIAGVAARGFLRVGPDRYREMGGGGPNGPEFVADSAIERLISSAGLVVALGVDGALDDGVARALGRMRSGVLAPVDAAGAALAGVAVGDALAGEWYVLDAPPSPIGGEAAGIVQANLPPLSDALPRADGGVGALGVRRRSDGARTLSAVALERDGDRRVAVLLARGFWRWAARGGEPRDSYRRLWAAATGWILAARPVAARRGARPETPVQPVDEPVAWRASGAEGDSVALSATAADGRVALDTLVTVPANGRFVTPPLPPGRYEWRARGRDSTAGRLDVEAFSGDMLRPVRDAARLSVAAGSGEAFPAAAGGRRLRAWPPVYLLVLLALCAEWIGRRRSGLR